MKTVFIIALTALSFSAFSALSDLQYLPTKGGFFSSTTFDHGKTDVELTYQNQSYYETETKVLATSEELGYGVTDNFYFSTDISYFLKGETDGEWGPGSIYDGTKDSYESKGLSDIQLNAKVRLWKSDASALDFTISFSPKTADAESASTDGKDGNRFRGGSLLSGEIEYGTKIERMQVSGFGTIAANLSRKVKELGDDSITDYKSSTDFGLGIRGRYFINDHFHLDAEFGLTMYGEIDYTNAGTQTTIDLGTGISYALTLGYELIANRMLAQISFGNQSNDSDLTRGSTFIDGDASTTMIGGRVLLQF